MNEEQDTDTRLGRQPLSTHGDLPRQATSTSVQDIAAVAWRCIRQCKDHQPPPVLCLKHQLEAEDLLKGQL